jgi:hypothetical protein
MASAFLQVGFVSQLNLTGKVRAFPPIPLAHLFSVRWLEGFPHFVRLAPSLLRSPVLAVRATIPVINDDTTHTGLKLMPTLFISYKRDDKVAVTKITDRLKREYHYDILAIDGKTSRRSHDKGIGQGNRIKSEDVRKSGDN